MSGNTYTRNVDNDGMSNPLEDIKAMTKSVDALGFFRGMAGYDQAYVKRDIAVLQIALVNDAHKPHLTPGKRQEAYWALAQLEAYRDGRQALIDGCDLQYVHTSKSDVTVLSPGDVGLSEWNTDPD